MKKFLIGLLIIAICSAPAHATGCRAIAVVRKQNVIVTKAAIVTTAVVPVVAQYVNVPLYSAIYQEGNNELLRQLIAQNQTLIQQNTQFVERLRSSSGSGNVPPMGPADPVKPPTNDPFNPNKGTAPQGGNPDAEVLQMFSSSGCVSCHDATKAQTLGGKFVLTLDNGKSLNPKLTPDDFGKVISNVADGTMPKGRQLSAEQRLLFISKLVKQ